MTQGKTFGKIIRDRRQELGFSQREIASKIKKENGEQISPQYQNDIEFDRRDPPSDDMIEQYAKVLELPKESLILAAGRVPPDVRKFAADNPLKAHQFIMAFRKKTQGSS
jgi:transcriptional regulator with XRE-family HTH domain